MSEYLINDTTLESIADKVRDINGQSEQLYPSSIIYELGLTKQEVNEQNELLSSLIQVINQKSGSIGPYVEMTLDDDDMIVAAKFYGFDSIYSNALKGQENLETVELPENITSIGESAFEGCHNLSEINISDSITDIGENAFWYCQSLSIDIPNTLRTIKYGSFGYCILPAELELPNVEYIEECAFEGCSTIESIKLGQQVDSIELDSLAFSSCENLRYIEIDANITGYDEGHVFDYDDIQIVWIRESCEIIAEAFSSPHHALFAGGNGELTIYLEADEVPEGFGQYWNRCGEDGEVVASYNLGQKTRPW